MVLQPIYNKTQREVLWDLEAGFMEKKEFNTLMDTVIHSTPLPGSTPQDPKKEVQVMVCCDFEDTCVVEDKFFSWKPVPLEMLPPFTLCDPVYWNERYNRGNNPLQALTDKHEGGGGTGSLIEMKNKLSILNYFYYFFLFYFYYFYLNEFPC